MKKRADEKGDRMKKEEEQKRDIPTKNLDDYNVNKPPIGLKTDGRR